MTDGVRATKLQPLCLTQEYSEWPSQLHMGLAEISLVNYNTISMPPYVQPCPLYSLAAVVFRALPNKPSAWKSLSQSLFLEEPNLRQQPIWWKSKVQNTELHTRRCYLDNIMKISIRIHKDSLYTMIAIFVHCSFTLLLDFWNRI